MNGSTVYLLDDELGMVELLADVVELAGLNAKSYTRATHFFEQVTVFDHNAILVLDLDMPEMDGIEAMRRLAKTENPPRIILISGADIGLLQAAKKLGQAHDLEILATLSKPIDTNNFRQLLEQQFSIGKRHSASKSQSNRGVIASSELRRAIRNEELILHYQPQLNMATGRLVGVESLVRWNNPELGLVYPNRIIFLAETSGLIGELTHWVIEQSIRQNQRWQAQGLAVIVSINISAEDITTLTLPEHMAALLSSNLLDPTMLTLEVTESVLMGDLVTSLDILTRLRLKGISLSIDDFGTGYSSLSQLHKIPFTELKIDSSFVGNIAEDKEARAIVKTCIILGHELNMRVVAEGVEDWETWNLLANLGCDVAQGNFVAEPMPANEFLDWSLRNTKNDPQIALDIEPC